MMEESGAYKRLRAFVRMHAVPRAGGATRRRSLATTSVLTKAQKRAVIRDVDALVGLGQERVAEIQKTTDQIATQTEKTDRLVQKTAKAILAKQPTMAGDQKAIPLPTSKESAELSRLDNASRAYNVAFKAIEAQLAKAVSLDETLRLIKELQALEDRNQSALQRFWKFVTSREFLIPLGVTAAAAALLFGYAQATNSTANLVEKVGGTVEKAGVLIEKTGDAVVKGGNTSAQVSKVLLIFGGAVCAPFLGPICAALTVSGLAINRLGGDGVVPTSTTTSYANRPLPAIPASATSRPPSSSVMKPLPAPPRPPREPADIVACATRHANWIRSNPAHPVARQRLLSTTLAQSDEIVRVGRITREILLTIIRRVDDMKRLENSMSVGDFSYLLNVWRQFAEFIVQNMTTVLEKHEFAGKPVCYAEELNDMVGVWKRRLEVLEEDYKCLQKSWFCGAPCERRRVQDYVSREFKGSCRSRKFPKSPLPGSSP